MRTRLALLAALCLAVAAPASAQGPGVAEGQPQPSRDATARAMRTLHWVSELQSMLAQRAFERTGRDEVRRYARRVVFDHQRTDAELLAIAATLGIDLEPTVAEQQGRDDQIAQIQSRLEASEGQFDEQYLRVVEESHRGALRQLARLRREVDSPELRELLTLVLPLLEQHQLLARRLREDEPRSPAT